MTTVPPLNPADPHDEHLWRSRVYKVSEDLGRYVLREIDISRGSCDQPGPETEHQLGERLVELGHQFQERAGLRGYTPPSNTDARELDAQRHGQAGRAGHHSHHDEVQP